MRKLALGLTLAVVAGTALVAAPDRAHAQFGLSVGFGQSPYLDPAYDDEFGWGPAYQPQNVFGGGYAYGTPVTYGYDDGPSYVQPVASRRVVVRESYAPRRVVVRQVYQPRRVVVRRDYAPSRVVVRRDFAPNRVVTRSARSPYVVTGPVVRARSY